MKDFKLDEWDIKLIKYSKTLNSNIEGYKTIWAEHCAVDKESHRFNHDNYLEHGIAVLDSLLSLTNIKKLEPYGYR